MTYKSNLRKELMELTLPRAIENYTTALTLEGKSPETILWYRKKLAGLATFMQNGEAPAKVRSLTLDDGRSFIKSLMERTTRYTNHCLRHEEQGGLPPQSIHGYVRALRAFATWLQEENYTKDNIFKGIKPPHVPQVLTQPLSEDEIRRVLIAAQQHTGEGVRNYAMILLFLDTGIRLSELVNLKISDLPFA